MDSRFAPGSSDSAIRSDRVLPLTRRVAWLIVPFLVAAFIILYVDGTNTATWFAWEIPSRLTTALMGAGYLGGAYFFLRVGLSNDGHQTARTEETGLTTTRWHHVQAGFLPVTAYTSAMLVATLLHWDAFLTGNWPFWVWLVLYITTPFLVAYLWWRNKPLDPHTYEADDRRVPLWLRQLMMVAGIALIAGCLVGFIWPELFISLWPWTLSPLTARVMAGFHMLLGIGSLVLGLERRWSGWRIPMQAIGIWYVLVSIALVWHAEELGDAGLLNWYTVFAAGGLVGLIGVWLIVRRRPTVAQ